LRCVPCFVTPVLSQKRVIRCFRLPARVDFVQTDVLLIFLSFLFFRLRYFVSTFAAFTSVDHFVVCCPSHSQTVLGSLSFLFSQFFVIVYFHWPEAVDRGVPPFYPWVKCSSNFSLVRGFSSGTRMAGFAFPLSWFPEFVGFFVLFCGGGIVRPLLVRWTPRFNPVSTFFSLFVVGPWFL